MLEFADFQRINSFKDQVSSYLLGTQYAAFRAMVSELLSKIFQYDHVVFGYLDAARQKEISYDITTYRIDQQFVQSFLGASIFQEHDLFDEDIIIFSKRKNYKKRTVYKELMAASNFSDFMLFYLTYQSSYNAYIIILKDTSQGEFTQKDREVIECINDFLGVAYNNYVTYLKLKMVNDLLVSQTDFYPIGIIMMKDFSSVTYANSTAEEYLRDLGISNLKFFSLFYTNEILPYVKFNLLSPGKKQIVRHKNYIFNMVTTNDFSDSYYVTLEKARAKHSAAELHGIRQGVTSIVYILKDELSSFNKDKDFYAQYSMTKQEEKIADCILLGKNNKQIAEELDISLNTVRVHMRNIYSKLAVTNRTELLFKLNSTSKI